MGVIGRRMQHTMSQQEMGRECEDEVEEEEHEDEVHFKKIPVLKITSDFGYVQIDPLEKLEENTEIVTDGAYFLMAQSKKGEEGAGGHHH